MSKDAASPVTPNVRLLSNQGNHRNSCSTPINPQGQSLIEALCVVTILMPSVAIYRTYKNLEQKGLISYDRS